MTDEYVTCYRCTMRFRKGEPPAGKGEWLRCPEEGCGRRFATTQPENGQRAKVYADA